MDRKSQKSARQTETRRREEAVDWLLRRQDRTFSDDEAQAFRAWLAKDARNPKAYEQAQRLMGDARSAILSDPALSSYEPAPASRVYRNLVVAALATATGLFFAFDGPMRLRADAMSDPGELPLFTLADGTIMQLNGRSAVAFDFDGTTRTVRLLRGEAFFQVAKDPARPFAVESDGAKAVALGTAFDVRLGGGGMDVTVTEHVVQVTGASSSNGVRVGEGETVAVSGEGVGAVRAAAEDALAWRNGRLVADNMPLSEVVEAIGRHYPGRIFIADSDLAELRVSGTFTVTDPDAAFAVLEQTLRLKVFRLGLLAIVRT